MQVLHARKFGSEHIPEEYMQIILQGAEHASAFAFEMVTWGSILGEWPWRIQRHSNQSNDTAQDSFIEQM